MIYAPGTIAVIKAECRREPFRAYRTEVNGWWPLDDGHWNVIHPDTVTDVRPLVVLDLDDARAVVAHIHNSVTTSPLLSVIADQIEAQMRPPPKPSEPTGLGAVVEDAEGKRWVRIDLDGFVRAGDHDNEHRSWAWYDGIDAVRVLSEGVPTRDVAP